MHFLISSTPKTEVDLSQISQFSSKSNLTESNDSSSPSSCPLNQTTQIVAPMRRFNRQEGAKITRSSTKTLSIVTKNGSFDAKDVDTCLMCGWTFPHSFGGEEKNVHINRCMEGNGDEDKKHWMRCLGNIKQYKYVIVYNLLKICQV